jgi:hypothetical protein
MDDDYQYVDLKYFTPDGATITLTDVAVEDKKWVAGYNGELTRCRENEVPKIKKFICYIMR